MYTHTILAKFYDKTKTVKPEDIRRIVIHCTESTERANGAIGVARWFANPWDGRKKKWIQASAHIAIDDKNTVLCVPLEREAWHARGGNEGTIGIELVGSASQTREQWLDEYSDSVLHRAARVVAQLCIDYEIPLIMINEMNYFTTPKGITTHRVVTAANKIAGGHTDPGPNWPWDVFLGYCQIEVIELFRV